MKRLVASFVAVGVLVGSVGQADGQSGYTYTTLPDPPQANTPLPGAINNAGQIVGIYWDSLTFHPFLLSGGTYTTLPPSVPLYRAYVTGINDTGQITLVQPGGRESYSSSAYLLNGRTLTPLGMPGWFATSVGGINNAGQIVGYYQNFSGDVVHSFVLSGGSYTSIGVPWADNTFPHGINDSGQVVGQYYASGGAHGFLFSGGSYSIMDVPGALGASVQGINNSGQVVGSYTSPDLLTHGFLFSGGSYTTLDVPGAFFTNLTGINDAGEIVGSYVDRAGVNHGFVATPTPEPSSLLLLGMGSVCLIGWLSRHRLRARASVVGGVVRR